MQTPAKRKTSVL